MGVGRRRARGRGRGRGRGEESSRLWHALTELVSLTSKEGFAMHLGAHVQASAMGPGKHTSAQSMDSGNQPT